MDNNIDNKKIIQMVVIIGILCILVGLATRIRQNNQKTLIDTKNNGNSISEAEQSESTSDTVSISDTSVTDNISTSESSNIKADKADNDNSSDSNNMTDEEYNGFHYSDNEPGMPKGTTRVHVLYFNSQQQISDGVIECPTDSAYEIMLIFYKLYKNQYEFTGILPLSYFENETESRLANNTYYSEGVLHLNPLYNPVVSYENDDAICIPAESEAYLDRTLDFVYKINPDDYAYRLLTEYGYYWGGNRNSSKDYSAFTK